MQDLAAVALVVSAVAFACGVAVVARGINRWRAGAAPPVRRSKIGGLPEHATCRVIGAVAPTARAVVAPLTGQPCVYYRVRVLELRARSGLASESAQRGRRRSMTRGRHHREWVPLVDEQQGVAFVVDDGSGQIRIDPEDAAIELRTRSVHETTGALLTRDQAALLRRYRVGALDGLGMPRRLRFEQVAIEIGQAVAAVGTCARDPATSTTDLWGLRPPSTALRMAEPRISEAAT
jgi:hypothetical protein